MRSYALVARLALGLMLVAAPGCDSTGPGVARAFTSRLVAGEHAACALLDSAVYCWGANTQYHEFAVPPEDNAGTLEPSPVPVPSLAAFARGAGQHYCGIDADGIGICWARGEQGQLGGGTMGAVGNPPTYISMPKRWLQLDVGRLTTCGVTVDNAGYCWGRNQRGALGDEALPINQFVPAPNEIMGSRKWKTVVTGWLHSCGITLDNETLCWGGNESGQLGIGATDTLSHPVPAPVAGGHTFVQLTAGARHTCGITGDAVAYCWGLNAFGEVGDGSTTTRAAPRRVAGGQRFHLIVTATGFAGGSNIFPPDAPSGGLGHTCALTADGAAWCWGWNGNGQLGDASRTNSSVPVRVAGGLSFETLALGGTYSCGMKGDRVWCWGAGILGQLGNGTLEFQTTPAAVGPPFSG